MKQSRLIQLQQMAQHYNTDKLQHGYLPYYDRYLPKEVGSLLEIGCFKGASAFMWRALFPKAEIHVADLFLDPDNVTPHFMHTHGVATHKGDQSDLSFLYTIKPQFDVIIDDGSHNADHQQISFAHLFVNNMKSGSLYVVEDLHCCTEPFYWNKHPQIKSEKDTLLGAIKEMMHGQFGDGNHFYDAHTLKILRDHIADCWLCDNKIAFIKRK